MDNPEVLKLAAQLAKEIIAQTRAQDPKQSITVAQVIDAYTSDKHDEVSPVTMKSRLYTLALFRAEFGEKRVVECVAMDLKNFLRNHPKWTSPWTQGRIVIDVKRVFNWALEMGLIDRYPFRGLKLAKGKNGRPMKDSHYRALLRRAHPVFKRFLVAMRYVGARPSELARLTWAMIDWDKSTATLLHHKTARKTGCARILVLPPPIIKMFAWMRKRLPPLDSTETWLANLLRAGPMRIHEVNRHARERGVTARMLWLAKERIGARLERRRVPCTPAERKHRHATLMRHVYVLDKEPKLRKRYDLEFVFVNQRGLPWTRRALILNIQRIRRKTGIPMGVGLYQLRHALATELVRENVNLKIVAALLGHRQLSTTMVYVNTVGEDPELLQAALRKVQQSPRNGK